MQLATPLVLALIACGAAATTIKMHVKTDDATVVPPEWSMSSPHTTDDWQVGSPPRGQRAIQIDVGSFDDANGDRHMLEQREEEVMALLARGDARLWVADRHEVNLANVFFPRNQINFHNLGLPVMDEDESDPSSSPVDSNEEEEYWNKVEHYIKNVDLYHVTFDQDGFTLDQVLHIHRQTNEDDSGADTPPEDDDAPFIDATQMEGNAPWRTAAARKDGGIPSAAMLMNLEGVERDPVTIEHMESDWQGQTMPNQQVTYYHHVKAAPGRVVHGEDPYGDVSNDVTVQQDGPRVKRSVRARQDEAVIVGSTVHGMEHSFELDHDFDPREQGLGVFTPSVNPTLSLVFQKFPQQREQTFLIVDWNQPDPLPSESTDSDGDSNVKGLSGSGKPSASRPAAHKEIDWHDGRTVLVVVLLGVAGVALAVAVGIGFGMVLTRRRAV